MNSIQFRRTDFLTFHDFCNSTATQIIFILQRTSLNNLATVTPE